MQQPLRWEFAAAWLLGALLCAQLAAMILVREPALPDAELWATLVGQGLWLCLAAAAATLPRGGSTASRLGLGPGRLRSGTLALLALGLLALSDGLSALLTALELRHTGTLGEMERLVAATRGPSFALALVSLGLVPGITEEILFRGLVQRALTRRLGRLAGIVLAAALFAVAHADPAQSAAAFFLGLYLGAVAELAGSTRPAIVCHVANNLLATAAARAGGVPLPGGPALVAPLLMGIAVAVLVWAWRRERPPVAAPRGSDPEEQEPL